MNTAGRDSDDRTAFERAVERERDAIRRHESAAQQQEVIAAALERHAVLHTRDDLARDQAFDNAAHARDRAELARARAAAARQRLQAEGEDPERKAPDARPPAS